MKKGIIVLAAIILGLAVTAALVTRDGERVTPTGSGIVSLPAGDFEAFTLGGLLVNMQKNFPNAPVTETQAGHFLQEEVPLEIAAAIIRVVDAAEQAGD